MAVEEFFRPVRVKSAFRHPRVIDSASSHLKQSRVSKVAVLGSLEVQVKIFVVLRSGLSVCLELQDCPLCVTFVPSKDYRDIPPQKQPASM